jgi:ATP-dependent DNA ligase
LLFRREWPHFFAFDLPKIAGRDLWNLALIERKQVIMPKVESRLRYVQHIDRKGAEFYSLAFARDLERIVAKFDRSGGRSGRTP